MIEQNRGFLILVDEVGRKHALRMSSLQAISEDPETDRVLLAFNGGRVVAVEESFLEALRSIGLA